VLTAVSPHLVCQGQARCCCNYVKDAAQLQLRQELHNGTAPRINANRDICEPRCGASRCQPAVHLRPTATHSPFRSAAKRKKLDPQSDYIEQCYVPGLFRSSSPVISPLNARRSSHPPSIRLSHSPLFMHAAAGRSIESLLITDSNKHSFVRDLVH
jgi:hypothetical protein